MRTRGLAFTTAIAAILAATPAFAQPEGARSTNASENAASGPAANVQRYLMQYRAGNGDTLKAVIVANGGRVAFDYSSLINGLAADISPDGLRAVRQSGLATSIEEDAVRQLHGVPADFPGGLFPEFVPWGRDRVEADAVWSKTPNFGAADNGIAEPNVEPGSITGKDVLVGVLDTGIIYDHEDLADNIRDFRADGKIRDFIGNDGLGDPDPTDDTFNGHGTSTASVIASVDNDVGLIGVAPGAKISPYRVCDQTCPLSAIIGGLVQAVADGVDVINMSFGGPAGFNIEASAIQAANQAGVVLVASAGNDGSQKVQFPAGYDTVLAVGATDINDNPASFTNFGGWVDVVGPGVDNPTATCEGCVIETNFAEVSPTPRGFTADSMTNSGFGMLNNTEIVDVGRACNVSEGDTLDADPTGKVALIVRGDCSFAEKVAFVEANGAVGAVVYNNEPGFFFGTLGAYEAAGPSVSLSQEDGQLLAADIAGGTTTVDLEVFRNHDLYWFISGTSFSGPHVAGVAALVLEANPDLSPIEVRKIIEMTAEPLGANVIFANGMVRADKAVEAAQN